MISEKPRILYVAYEMTPFIEFTPIAQIIRKLPQAIQEKGYEIRIFMPKFSCVNERRNRLHEVIRLSGMNVVVNSNDNHLIIKVASIPQARVQVYFLDNEDYFHDKPMFYNSNNTFYQENDERMIFFTKGIIEIIKKLSWVPHLVHCHGWMSVLMPILIKTKYKDDPVFGEAKTIFSVYNDEFKGELGNSFMEKLQNEGIDQKYLKYFKKPDYFNMIKAGITYSDAIVKLYDGMPNEITSFVKNQKEKPQLDITNEDTIIDDHYKFYNELVEEVELTIAQ